MKFKKYGYIIAVLLIFSILLAGCGKNKLLNNYSDTLAEQEDMTLAQFQENFEQARELLASGVKPKGSLPVYDPASGNLDPAGDLAQSGLYAVKLDPGTYGVSNFYVIPAGERPMTAEEYLELAQMSGLTGPELVMTEHSWLSFQDQSTPSTRSIRENRILSQKERFWQMFQYYETVRNGETKPQIVPPVTVYVDTAEPQPFFLLPASDMDEASLRGYMAAYVQALPPEVQTLFPPTEEELTWEEAVTAARAAIAEHGGRDDEPIKDYVYYQPRTNTLHPDVSSWEVALYYADGSCYSVLLDSATGEIKLINKMQDDIYNYESSWADRAPNANVVEEMIYPEW